MVTHPSSRFSMSLVDPVEPVRVTRSHNTRIHRLQRRVVVAWKVLTQATSHRSSTVPKDFVLLTSRRRSILPPPNQARRRYNAGNT
jgi:hypothetical protein